MARFILNCAFVALALYGLGHIATDWLLPFYAARIERTPISIQRLASPNDKMTAITASYISGSAFATFCQDSVSVSSNDTSNEEAIRTNLVVFRANCFPLGVSAPSQVKWLTDKKLQITTSTGVLRNMDNDFLLLESDQSGLIDVELVVHR